MGRPVNNDTLYACALEKRGTAPDGSPAWIPDRIEYIHAPDYVTAEMNMRVSASVRGKRVVSVGQVIAYKVLDKQGMLLSV